MVDDLLVVSKCGNESIKANIFIETEIDMKKLKLNQRKCQIIHVSKRQISCQELRVQGETMARVDFDTYLGDIITKDGKNTKNIDRKVSKGLGIVNQIIDILRQVHFGTHYFEIAIALREALLVNGVLTNSGLVWLDGQ